VFVVRADGEMAVMSVMTDKEVLGWSRFTTWVDGDPNMGFKDCVVVKADSGDGVVKDTLYVIVERPNGTFIEALTEDNTHCFDHFYVGEDDPAKTTWTGADTLEMYDAGVVGDGLNYGTVSVTSGGDFMLDEAVSAIVVGFPYTCTFESLTIRPSFSGESVRGRTIRLIDVEVDVLDSIQCKVNGYEALGRTWGDDVLDGPLPAFTGMENVKVAGNIGKSPTITVTVDTPFRCTLLALTIKIKVGE
jgi:hypothetical protein